MTYPNIDDPDTRKSLADTFRIYRQERERLYRKAGSGLLSVQYRLFAVKQASQWRQKIQDTRKALRCVFTETKV